MWDTATDTNLTAPASITAEDGLNTTPQEFGFPECSGSQQDEEHDAQESSVHFSPLRSSHRASAKKEGRMKRGENVINVL